MTLLRLAFDASLVVLAVFGVVELCALLLGALIAPAEFDWPEDD